MTIEELAKHNEEEEEQLFSYIKIKKIKKYYPSKFDNQLKFIFFNFARKAFANIHFESKTTGIKNKKASRAGKSSTKTILAHNEREQKPDYLLDNTEVESRYYADKADIENIDMLIRADYREFHKRSMPYNAETTKESILNLHEKHTLKDIEEAIKSLNLPMKPLHIAIHKDEGRINQFNGKPQKNYHAHILFQNYDFETHRTALRTLTRKQLSELPKRLSEALKMPLNEEVSKTKIHLNKWQMAYKTKKIVERKNEIIKKIDHILSQEPEIKMPLNETIDDKKRELERIKKELNDDFLLGVFINEKGYYIEEDRVYNRKIYSQKMPLIDKYLNLNIEIKKLTQESQKITEEKLQVVQPQVVTSNYNTAQVPTSKDNIIQKTTIQSSATAIQAQKITEQAKIVKAEEPKKIQEPIFELDKDGNKIPVLDKNGFQKVDQNGLVYKTTNNIESKPLEVKKIIGTGKKPIHKTQNKGFER